VDPNRLRFYKLPLSAVLTAVRDSNLNVGGNGLESSVAWLIVRGVGLIQSVDDVKKIVVGAAGGVPVTSSRLRTCAWGNAFPRRLAREGHERSSGRGRRGTHRRARFGSPDEEAEFPFVEFVAADSLLQGIEAHSDVDLGRGVSVDRGKLKQSNEPLPRIPPFRVRGGLRYQRAAFQAGGEVLAISKQDRVDPDFPGSAALCCD